MSESVEVRMGGDSRMTMFLGMMSGLRYLTMDSCMHFVCVCSCMSVFCVSCVVSKCVYDYNVVGFECCLLDCVLCLG